uniref:Uncharacterized protein n=1 Tax=Oryza meridionalis TaxID=40149 RepID=A0A0E0BZW6_9ORYZ
MSGCHVVSLPSSSFLFSSLFLGKPAGTWEEAAGGRRVRRGGGGGRHEGGGGGGRGDAGEGAEAEGEELPWLPPPPKQRELDALPSKLRRLIAIQEKHKGGEKGAVAGDSSGKQGESDGAKNKARKDKALRKKTKKQNLEPAADSKAAEISDKDGPIGDENASVDESKTKRKRLWIFVSNFIGVGALSSFLQGGSGAVRRTHLGFTSWASRWQPRAASND